MDHSIAEAAPTVTSARAPAAPSQTRAPRHDLYAQIHKALRLAMVDTLTRVGRLDADDEAEVKAAVAAVRDLVSLCRMFVSFLLQIGFRYLLNRPLGWTDEVTVLCWVWLVLWGAAFILSDKDEIRFDIVYGLVSSRTRRTFTILSSLVLVALFAISLPAAWSYVVFMLRAAASRTSRPRPSLRRRALLHTTLRRVNPRGAPGTILAADRRQEQCDERGTVAEELSGRHSAGDRCRSLSVARGAARRHRR